MMHQARFCGNRTDEFVRWWRTYWISLGISILIPIVFVYLAVVILGREIPLSVLGLVLKQIQEGGEGDSSSSKRGAKGLGILVERFNFNGRSTSSTAKVVKGCLRKFSLKIWHIKNMHYTRASLSFDLLPQVEDLPAQLGGEDGCIVHKNPRGQPC
jgi:hypothetical protein